MSCICFKLEYYIMIMHVCAHILKKKKLLCPTISASTACVFSFLEKQGNFNQIYIFMRLLF